MFLNLDAYHPDTAYICEQGCEDRWLFFEDKSVGDQNCLETADIDEGSLKSGRQHGAERGELGEVEEYSWNKQFQDNSSSNSCIVLSRELSSVAAVLLARKATRHRLACTTSRSF